MASANARTRFHTLNVIRAYSYSNTNWKKLHCYYQRIWWQILYILHMGFECVCSLIKRFYNTHMERAFLDGSYIVYPSNGCIKITTNLFAPYAWCTLCMGVKVIKIKRIAREEDVSASSTRLHRITMRKTVRRLSHEKHNKSVLTIPLNVEWH